jgi:tetratricopeptide (TPR) repeat protein
MLLTAWSCVIVVSAALGQAVVAAPPSRYEIAQAIENLGAGEFEKREAATELLWKAGKAAEEPLLQAIKSSDPEVRTRAEALLARLRLGIRPETPPEVAALIDQFRFGGTAVLRRQALSELQAKGHWQAILTLIRGEQNTQERNNLATAISADAGKLVLPLVERGEFEQAEEILELVATAEPGVSQLAAFLLMTDRLESHLAAARERASMEPSDESWTRLAYLLRAKGNQAGAFEAAAKTTDLILQANLAAEAGRWESAAAVADELFRRSPTRLETAAFAATFYRLAGNQAEHQRVIAALLKAANVDRLKENAQPERPADPFAAPPSQIGQNNLWTAAETLLINERIEEALSILRKTNPRFAHAIYCRQLRHREALEFVGLTNDKPLDRAWFDKLPGAASEGAARQELQVELALQVARQLRELGRSEQCEQVCQTLMTLVERFDRGQRLAMIAALRWQMGRIDEAARDAALAMAAGATPQTVFTALTNKQLGPLAASWFDQWTSENPNIDRQKAVESALCLVVPAPPRGKAPANWRELITAGQAAAQKLEPATRAQRLVAIGQTSQIRGDIELARQYLAEAAVADPSTADRAADLSATTGNWGDAAKYYGIASKNSPGDASLQYLHGYALKNSGVVEAGETEMLQARLVTLAPVGRLKLPVALLERGIKDNRAEGVQEFEFVRRTALPDSPQASSAAHFIGNIVSDAEPLRAADCWEQLRLHLLNPGSNYVEVEKYLKLSHVIHKVRAKAAIGSGDAEKAAAELKLCDGLLPGDVDTIVELVPKLSRAGMTAAADQLFNRGFEEHRRVCDEFPTCAMHLNNAAWLCARSQRKLDEALALVEKAIAIAPEQAPYHDTLAEIHFQRGDRVAAVAAAKKCVELAPYDKLFVTRLKHFESDELKTLDQIESN